MHMLTSIVLVFLFVATVPPVHAQTSHAAPEAALDAAVREHVASRDGDLEAISRLLARPDVQKIAGDAGIDLRRAERGVATFDGSSLAEIAVQARQVEDALAGGQSRITISTTTIIIALLVIILIIVAVD
jgi:hypothetical protein